MSKKIRIFQDVRRKKERWFVVYGKEILSGPWDTSKEALEAKQEWIKI